MFRGSALGRMIEKLVDTYKPRQEPPERGRLRASLLNLARAEGFDAPVRLLPNPTVRQPDVCLRRRDGWLFVGIPKDAAEAAPLGEKAAAHVRRCFKQFQEDILAAGKRGIFA